MFLNNKQTLLLAGLVTLFFFLGGVFDVVNNFMVDLVLLVGFVCVIVNIILSVRNKKNPD